MDLEVLTRLVVAAVLTAAIGIDRELRSKPAGLRTNIVVGTATAAFAYTGAVLFEGGDPTRVASQVVSGIGFLGGGAIFASGGKPHGLTTAAALWGSAAVGLAAGVGAYDVAVALVVVTIVALWPLDLIAGRILGRYARRESRIHVALQQLSVLPALEQALRADGCRVRDVALHEVAGSPVTTAVLVGSEDAISRAVERGAAVPGAEMLVRGGSAEDGVEA